MSLEAMDAIALAEEKARQIRAAAAVEAKRLEDEAEQAVKAAIEAAESTAKAEIHDLIKKADEKSVEDASVLASNTRNRKAAMKARADRKMDEAVALVLERVVNG